MINIIHIQILIISSHQSVEYCCFSQTPSTDFVWSQLNYPVRPLYITSRCVQRFCTVLWIFYKIKQTLFCKQQRFPVQLVHWSAGGWFPLLSTSPVCSCSKNDFFFFFLNKVQPNRGRGLCQIRFKKKKNSQIPAAKQKQRKVVQAASQHWPVTSNILDLAKERKKKKRYIFCRCKRKNPNENRHSACGGMWTDIKSVFKSYL